MCCARADKVVERLLHVGHSPVRARAWRTREGYVHIRAEPVDPASVLHPVVPDDTPARAEIDPAGEAELGIAIERVRFSLAVEDDMGEFFQTFKRDPLLGSRHPSQAVGSPQAEAVAVGGALLGGHLPADRGLARRRDPAADRQAVGAELSAEPAGAPAAPRALLAAPRRALGRGDRR